MKTKLQLSKNVTMNKPDEKRQGMKVRTVVTGHDAKARAVFVRDEKVDGTPIPGLGELAFQRKASSPRPGMGVPSTFSSRTKTARALASWPVTTVRTFIPCLFSSGLFMVTFLDSCNLVFIFNFPFVLLKSFSVNA